MLRRAAIAAALALPVAVTGCTATGSSSSSKFTGAEADVAKVVSDLSTAGKRKDAQKICTEILSQQLVRQLSDAGTSCAAEMKKAIDDADDFNLDVQSVDVKGNKATAVVQRGSDGPKATFSFVRESGGWRATSFGG